MDPQNKIINSYNELKIKRRTLSDLGRKAVFTSGCFDVLHEGHLKYLLMAASYGDELFVGIDSDALVRFHKGLGRPLKNHATRAYLIAGFGCVDHVFIMNDWEETLSSLKPDLLISSETTGMNRFDTQKVEEFVSLFGGRLIILPAQSDIHSSDFIKCMA